MRKEVEWFAEKMEEKLKRDDESKSHWLKTSYGYLFCRLGEEIEELQELLDDDNVSYKHKKIIKECADIANFAMMIADKAKNGSIY